MDSDRFNKQISFLIEIDKMKQVCRNTILMDSSRKENDAEHSWHMAVAAMLLLEYSDEKDIDLCKVFKMVLIHDLVEIDAGDTFAYGNFNPQEKAEKEKKAAERIFGLLPKDQADELMSLWCEFEEFETGEAKFAHALDSFMPILHNYMTKGQQWQRLNVTREKVLARNRRIEKGSKALGEYIKSIVDDAVKKGYLQG